MRYGWVAFFLISIGLISKTCGSTGDLFQTSLKEPHRVSIKECNACHVDAQKDPGIRKPMFNSKCVGCHADLKESRPHPVDIVPHIPVPADMPLVRGKLGCITCHFFHPSSAKFSNRSGNLLRRPGRGAVYCVACHRINQKDHIAFENIHRDSYRNLAVASSRLDIYTLQCVECHDKYLDRSFGSFAAGGPNRISRLSSHPVGVSLERISAQKPNGFNFPHTLPGEIRLFDGKIGCGTCHNAFSKEKSMLVMNNWRSRLCLKCHKK